MSEDHSTPKRPTPNSEISSMITAILNEEEEEEETSVPLERYLAEEPPPSIEPPSTPLPTSTPTEPRAMTIAKARHRSPQKSTQQGFLLGKSMSPSPADRRRKHKSPDHISSPAKPVTNTSSTLSSPNAIFLPKRAGKRARDRSSSPPAKRVRRRQHTPTPRAQNDHWSPLSSRASSPVRSVVLVPAAQRYDHSKTNRITASPGIPRRRASGASPHASKAEAKKYPTSTSVMIGGFDHEDGKKICYNCGKRGHWFMDCNVGCGKCGGDGHRTIDCVVVRSHQALRG